MGANIEMAGDPSLDSAKDIEAGAERTGLEQCLKERPGTRSRFYPLQRGCLRICRPRPGAGTPEPCNDTTDGDVGDLDIKIPGLTRS